MAKKEIDEQDLLSPIYNFEDDEEEEDNGSSMSLVEHLEELRWRIFKSLIAIAVAACVAFVFRGQIVHFLSLPLPAKADPITHGKPVVIGITEGFTVFLLISVAFGFVWALPI